MTIALLSLAGIPPLAGFFGKYLVFSQALENGYTGMVIIAVATSLIGVFYYFRVIVDMFLRDSENKIIQVSLSARILMTLLSILALALGLFPDKILMLIAQ